ncbi:hypothetical protein M527_16025 [Sphingobium indicum IP26]|uniref:Uncharacterized protein n=1 Tax=Sphingobium indicum F2 TaxID=1450518 RepID=A0A8E0WUN1_9SPHN|nr:hypothetical protein [Sphingobium indicum]EPR17567.1 hypothetical protein M527_16025 [Sphingobium indicum IP26]KER37636.1 hypothetical protein AL00_04295 [Sphingobium indicum F2]
MADAYILSCSVEPVNGGCPAGSEAWVSSTGLNAFALPSQAELTTAYNAAIEVFFIPSMIAMFAALGIRWICEAIN